MILGTAGHVDHGKTALVKALTGVDTDRLPEEKRRGITIDLGFAPLRFPDGLTLGVVDVPGHEAFVRTMLAGASGIDLALLVVAADEGVMPQTREHLAILTLLGIRGGVVALTKADLVDDEWIELVAEDVRETTHATPLENAAVVATSAITGSGVEALRSAIAREAARLPGRDAGDVFRMPVDRAFTVRGTGTVVTGTVWSGSAERDAILRILPGSRSARVRDIQMHGSAVARALPGMRAAIALSGVEVADAPRGTTLVAGEEWNTTQTLLAEVSLLDDAPRALTPRTTVRFHLGTQEVGARVVCSPGQGPLSPGSRKQARVALDAPVVARAGDRFVLRDTSPAATIGGGVIGDPAPAGRRARPWQAAATSGADRLKRALDADAGHGVPLQALTVRLGIPPSDMARAVEVAGNAVHVGDRLYPARLVDHLSERLLRMVEDHHTTMPLEAGVPVQSVRARLARDQVLAELVLRRAVERGAVDLDGAVLRLHGWSPSLSSEQENRTGELMVELERGGGREPPSVGELRDRFGGEVGSILRYLEREGRVVQVEPDRYYARSSTDAMINSLRGVLQPGREYAPGDFRVIFGISRKYLIPFLEFCDRIGVTERTTKGRKLLLDRSRPAF